jgi:hypothetical protein
MLAQATAPEATRTAGASPWPPALLALLALQVSLVYLAPRVLQGLPAPQAHLALSVLQGQALQGQRESQG